MKFSVKFKPGTDFWIYPEYILNMPAESMKGAIGISFDIKAGQKGGSKEYSTSLLMAVMENAHELGVDRRFEYKKPSSEWQRAFIMFEDSSPGFSPDNVKLLRLGMNPKEDELTYWIKNVKVYFEK